jgi:hypothetical protein
MARRKKNQQNSAAPDESPSAADPPSPESALAPMAAASPGTADSGGPDDPETRSQRAFFGRSGQLAAMAELLYRRINVAIPEVDVGDDIFVVKGSDDRVTRVQVKAANAEEQTDSYAARFNVPLAQLSVPEDAPSLVCIFPIRYRDRWSDFIVIHRSALFALHVAGAGQRFTDGKGGWLVQFRIVLRERTALCGPKGAADFQPYRNGWEPWPPASVSGSEEGIRISAPQVSHSSDRPSEEPDR